MTHPLRSALAHVSRAALRHSLALLGPTEAVPTQPIRRILVSGSMGIGNAVMLEPLLYALRQRFPDAHLAAATRADAPSRAVLEWPGLVDQVIPLRGNSRPALLREALRLTRGQWDLYVVRFNGATFEFVVSAVLGRVPHRLGHVSSGRFRSNVDWLFNLPVTMGDYDHEVDRYLALAERLGIIPSRRTPRLSLSEPARRAADSILRESGVRPADPLIALQPGTSGHQTWKRWPPEHWRSLAARLMRSGFTVVGLGSAGERQLLADIRGDSGLHNLAGELSLQESAAVIQRCKLLVSTDSGLMHVAAAVGTRVVGIFGPTDRTRTRPYGEGHTLLVPDHCRSHTNPCLSPDGQLDPSCTWQVCMPSIRPEEVLEAILRVAGPQAVASS
jgi:lipopolysaccharide heptosyltransferase II